MAGAQAAHGGPDAWQQRLRLLHAEQMLRLEMQQRDRSGGDHAAARGATLERLQQKRLQQRQAREQRALLRQRQVAPGVAARLRLSAQLQRFRRQHQAQALGFAVRRRAAGR